MNNFNILLYSKYSNNSTRLLELLKTNNIKEYLNLNLLCIDNENIRKRIKLSDVEITNVPCLLVVMNKIQVEKYEGQQLHDWIISKLQSNPQLMMPPQHHQQQMIPPRHHQQEMIPPPQHQQEMMHPTPQHHQQMMPLPPQHQQQMMMHQSPPQMMMEQLPPPPPQMMMEQLQPPPQMMMEQPMMDLLDNDLKNREITSIEGIVIEDDNINDDSSVKIPKKKKDSSKYNNFANNYDEYEQKNKKKEQKKLDLLNSAMQMKKAREDEDKSINNVYTKL